MAHLLLVEDDEAHAFIAGAMCRNAGHTLSWARQGEDALAHLATERFDLALVDNMMPVMNGLSLARAMRAHPVWGGIPIIGLSAMAFAHEQAAMREAGMTAILSKPYRREELVAAIAQVLAASTSPL